MEIKVDIMLEYTCNSNCIFCYAAEKRLRHNKPLPTEKVIEEMKLARERGATKIAFGGGEPTIRKDIIRIVRTAKELGFKQISVTTNGQMLSIEKFAKSIIEAGLNQVVFSIHGHRPEIHDIQTRVKGSFNRLMKALENVKKFGIQHIGVNCVVTKINYKLLPEIAEFLAKKGVGSMEFIFPHPEGGAKWRFEEIVPTLTELEPYVLPTIRQGVENGVRHTYFRYLPLCYLGGKIEYSSEIMERSWQRQQHVGPEFKDMNVEEGRRNVGKVKGPQCRICKLDQICEGIWKFYALMRGTDELKPVV